MIRRRHRLRYLIAAFGALALTAQLGINSPEAEASTDLRFWHFNMCGNKCWTAGAPHNYLPGTDTRGEIPVRAAQIVESVGNYSPDVVTLNEACYTQYRHIREALVAQGYHATYASSSQTSGEHCDGGDTAFGMALFSKKPIATPRETHNLGDTQIHALCADTALGSRPVKACSVHLSVDDPDDPADDGKREEQATKLAALASGWHATKPVVLMGDFNAQPFDADMDKFYSHSGGEGIFNEADESDADHSSSWPPGAVRGQSGEITFTSSTTVPPILKKIDYIFLSAADFRAVEGDSLYGGERRTSDHRVYRGGATWQ
ncbi:endonuclease/exonuclease/phosphatase family protein [Streptomyces sp. NPDC054796]